MECVNAKVSFSTMTKYAQVLERNKCDSLTTIPCTKRPLSPDKSGDTPRVSSTVPWSTPRCVLNRNDRIVYTNGYGGLVVAQKRLTVPVEEPAKMAAVPAGRLAEPVAEGEDWVSYTWCSELCTCSQSLHLF